MIALPPQEPSKPADDSGGMGGLFSHVAPGQTEQWHLRSDARLAARILSLGVVSDDQMQNLLKAGTGLAAAAANSGNARDYAAVMKIFVAAAKLELDTVKHTDPTPKTVLHAHATLQPEHRRSSITAEIVAELERRGIASGAAGSNGNGSGAGANGHTNGPGSIQGTADN